MRRNQQLSSLDGLDALSAVGGSVYVQDNRVLTGLGRVPETLKGHVTGVCAVQRDTDGPGRGRVPEKLMKGRVTGMRAGWACFVDRMPPYLGPPIPGFVADVQQVIMETGCSASARNRERYIYIVCPPDSIVVNLLSLRACPLATQVLSG